VLRILTNLAILFAIVAGVSQPMTTHAGSSQVSNRQYTKPQFYLALGDSISYGYQQWITDKWVAMKHSVPSPSAFTPNAVDDFAAVLRKINPKLQTANYACPGATSSNIMATNGCNLSRLAAHAVKYLLGRGAGVITIDDGANDLLALASRCGGISNVTCILNQAPTVLATVGLNTVTILYTLKKASPNSTIILLQLYNPCAIQSKASNAVAEALNQVLGIAAKITGAAVADAYEPFNVAQPQPQTLCRLSNICGPTADIHPTFAGYKVIAQLFAAAYFSAADPGPAYRGVFRVK
jgi:lysophospholipase L1-like esterase